MQTRRIARWTASLVLLSLLSLVWAGAGAQCADPPSIEDALRRVNMERAHGLLCGGAAREAAPAGPLRWNTGLAAVAAAQSENMVSLHRIGHRDGQDHTLAARLSAGGYRFSMAVENVAVGYTTADAVIDAWLSSAAHCTNLMNSSAVELGLACSDASPDAQDRYWTLVLGAPAR